MTTKESTLMTVTHPTSDHAAEHFGTALEIAKESRRWMAACWCYRPDGTVELVTRTTFNFPRDKFDDAVKLIADQCRQEKEGVLPDDPLPAAPQFVTVDRSYSKDNPVAMPDLNLFHRGDGPNGDDMR